MPKDVRLAEFCAIMLEVVDKGKGKIKYQSTNSKNFYKK